MKPIFKAPSVGIFPKLLLSFLALSIISLIVLGYMANRNMLETGLESIGIADEVEKKNLTPADRQQFSRHVQAVSSKSSGKEQLLGELEKLWRVRQGKG